MEEEKKFNPDDNYDVPMIQPIKIGKGKIAAMITVVALFLGVWFLYNELYVAEAQSIDEVDFAVEKGETINQLAKKLKSEKIIRNEWLFKKYLVWKGIDKKVQAGNFQVIYPITLVRVATSLKNAININERTITVLPGWDLRDIADYLLDKEVIMDKEDFFAMVGESAVFYKTKPAPKLPYDLSLLKNKPNNVGYDGYLAPDTYRIFEDADLSDVVKKLVSQQNKLFTDKMYEDIKNQGRNAHEILTIASIVEREVKSAADRAKVADIFWRRYENKWPLQADSTVHYAVNKKGDLFTTKDDRNSNSPWNTYQFAGLPPGPICAPSFDSIKAAIYPEANNYWYFLTTLDGEVKYGIDLDEHNLNVQKYLR